MLSFNTVKLLSVFFDDQLPRHLQLKNGFAFVKSCVLIIKYLLFPRKFDNQSQVQFALKIKQITEKLHEKTPPSEQLVAIRNRDMCQMQSPPAMNRTRLEYFVTQA